MTRREIFGVSALVAGFCFIIGILITLLLIRQPIQLQAPDNSNNLNSTSNSESTQNKSITVDAQKMWTDTGIQLKEGDSVSITATGDVNATNVSGDGVDKWVGPNGWGYQPEFYNGGVKSQYALVLGEGSSFMCLIGRVGNGKPFKVGSNYAFTASTGGRLYLGINDSVRDGKGNVIPDDNHWAWKDNRGSFTVVVTLKDNKSTEITLTGKEDGVRLGALKPGQLGIVTYVSGKIISNNKTGYTAPIWGIPIKDTDPNWIPLMPYASEGMWTNAVFVDIGGKHIPFNEGQFELTFKNDTQQEETAFLRFHEARGYYYDNEGDAKFRFVVK